MCYDIDIVEYYIPQDAATGASRFTDPLRIGPSDFIKLSPYWKYYSTVRKEVYSRLPLPSHYGQRLYSHGLPETSRSQSCVQSLSRLHPNHYQQYAFGIVFCRSDEKEQI